MSSSANQPSSNDKQRVLFLCTGNSCRSQMAEGLLREMFDGHFEALSAGTHPVDVNPHAIHTMQEAGIDISQQTAKSLKAFSGEKIDYVISVCDAASQLCPDFPGSQRIHWSIPDPAAATGDESEILDSFRWTRDHLRQRIEETLGTAKTA